MTGGGGFIGSHLSERLVSLGARTRALVRYSSSGSWGWLDSSGLRGDLEVVMGDVRDADGLRVAVRGVDVVFHLAALIAIPYSYSTPLSYIRTNVEGTANVLRAALEEGAGRIVHTSTSEVYGTARYVPIDEEHPLQGQSPYSASKIGADKIAESFYRSFGLPVATIRPFNTFGPRQSARAVIPTIVTQALDGGKVRLGNLAPIRDFTFVEDTVEGFVQAAEAEAVIGRVVNVGSGREISVRDLVGAVGSLIGSELEVIEEEERIRPEGSEVDRLCADARMADELLGWRPRWSLEEGLKATIAWIERNRDWYRAGTYAI